MSTIPEIEVFLNLMDNLNKTKQKTPTKKTATRHLKQRHLFCKGQQSEHLKP